MNLMILFKRCALLSLFFGFAAILNGAAIDGEEPRPTVSREQADELFEFLVGRWELRVKTLIRDGESFEEVEESVYPFEIERKTSDILIGFHEKFKAVIVYEYVADTMKLRYSLLKLKRRRVEVSERFDVVIYPNGKSFGYVRPNKTGIEVRYRIDGRNVRIEPKFKNTATWWRRIDSGRKDKSP